MKRFTLISSLFILFTASAFAQEVAVDNQNPNWKRSYETYKLQKDELTANQGETVQEQHQAIQHWYDLKDAKLQWKADKQDLKRQERLERARNPRAFRNNRNFYNNGWNNNRGFRPFISPNFGVNNFGGDWNWNYGLNFGLWPW